MAHSNDAEALGLRRPWYWLVVLALAAALATGVVAGNARARIAQDERSFNAAQQLRLERVEQRVDDYFSEAIELASFGAKTLGTMRGNLALTREVTRAILLSHHNPDVYGVGAFYAPRAFDPRFTRCSVYDELEPHGDGVGERVVETNVISPGHDYTQYAWYRRAVAAPGRTAFAGPYTHGISFISTVRAFYVRGSLVGVMIVDTMTVQFKALMASAISPGDVAWIESSRVHGGRRLLATSAIPAGPRIDQHLALRYTGAIVHLSTDAAPLTMATRDELSSSIGLIVGIWLVTGLIAMGLLQRWRARERQYSLEMEQRRLEAQIALSKTVEAELRKAAFTDSLTGLPNRAAFLEHVRSIIAAGELAGHAVFFIDLDRFNIVNETLGHLAGDELLRAIGGRLQALVEPTDLVVRLGGDEFVVVAKVESGSFDEAAALLLVHLGEPIVVAGRTIYPEASIGVVAVDDSYTTPSELLRDADIAMYEAKHRGRAQFAIFDADMRRRIADDSELEDDLRRAIDRGELVPYYQPIVSLATRRIVSFEALARWNRHGEVTIAGEFMHFAEQHGFIEAIDSMMFRAVCAHSQAIFASFPSAQISVNISAAELATGGLWETIETLIRQHDVPVNRLKFEITETAMMTSSEVARRTLERLRALGIEFVLDDFGTGYSSLAYLQRLPIAGIKIDRSFVQPLLTDPKAIEIVRSIVVLARSFGLTTTAEGVETVEHFELLAGLGVDNAQGFFFSPAVEIASLVLLQDRPISPSRQAAVE